MSLSIKRHGPLVGIIAGYFAVLQLFPLKNQAIEPYAYAAAAEGYYNLSQTFAAVAENSRLKDISRYHPNHPLPHYLASLFHAAFGFDALNFFKGLNLAGAMFFLCFFYFLVLRLLSKPATAAATTLLVAGTYAFWLSALSGEMQMLALALMTGGLYFVTVYLTGNREARFLVAAAILYVLAGAFHLFSFVLIFPAGIAVLVQNRGAHPWRLYAAVTGIVAVGYFFFYGFLLVRALSIGTLPEYLDTLFIYRNILLKAYAPGEWVDLFYKTALKAWVYADNVWGFLPKAALTVLLFKGYAALIRSRLTSGLKFLFVGWPALQVGLQIVVYGRPEGINFWLFLFPVFFVAIAFSLGALSDAAGSRLLPPALLLLTAGVNFFTGVLPNHRLQTEDYAYVQKPEAPREIPVAIVIHEPVLTFPEIWTLGSRYGFKNQKVFLPCCGEKDTEQKLVRWLGEQSSFLLITDEHADATEKLLVKENIRALRIQNRTGELSQYAVPSSLYLNLPVDFRYKKHLRVFLKLRS